jgi:predicted Rossmann fold nucleotide-binding protein DprA/Smf involved in DNA uptake
MIARTLTDDARATLLLCGRFGREDKTSEPLATREFNVMAEWLVSVELRPGDLLHDRGREQLRSGLLHLDLARVERLLERGMAMTFDTEKWINKGIWVVCRGDADYPARLRTHLRSQAPPILYCTGNPALLAGGGLAIVGSRNIHADGEAYTQRVARRCAEHGIPVVSGGARGVDQAAMLAALEADGRVLGVLADSLSRAAVSAHYREHLRAERLLLCCSHRPDAGFSTGLAMGRNRLIYAMADHALVIQCEKEKGGTWNGATEELRRSQARPVFVRIEDPVPEGNAALMKLGARSFPTAFFEKDPLDALQEAAQADEK